MDYSYLISEYNRIFELVFQKKIANAMDGIDKLAGKCRNTDFRNRLESNRETYRNILKYSFEAGNDPEKEKVYFRLVKSLTELTDEIREELIRQYNLQSFRKMAYRPGWKNDEGEIGLEDWLDRVSLEKEVERLLHRKEESPTGNQKEEELQAIMDNVFTIIWLSDKLKGKQIKMLNEAVGNPFLPWYYKSLIVSGITLSCLRHFDVEKLNILFGFYQEQENQVWQRALIGILICLYINDRRIDFYPEIGQRIRAFHGDKAWKKTVEAIIIQFLRARETEKVTEKIKEEIIPELWKAQSLLNDKLNLKELLSENMMDDKNPEWETVFEESPELYNKMEEFSNLQMEGSDVFISAFAMLKRFDFFNRPSNWFLPFYRENKMFENSFGEVSEGFDSSGFLEGLERTRFLCNSDKYSFCLNIRHMPPVQKSMMVEFFKMELDAMSEMEGNDLTGFSDMSNKAVIIQYIQDLYRFFRLHPMKKEFEDIFELPLAFHKAGFFRIMVDDQMVTRNIAEFYFLREHYQEALEIFTELLPGEKHHELHEKAGYCLQKLERYEEAIEFYKKAEMLSDPHTWLLNKIAYCYRKTGDFDAAIEYYRLSEKNDPENLFIQSSLGQVHMDKGDFEAALKYFFKVEYLAPDNLKVQRPVAWCSFVLKKAENARKYFEKVIAREGNQYDFMNMGHVQWCLGNKKLAIENYRLSIKKSAGDPEWFSRMMEMDKKYLLSYQIPEFDIPLMIDYLLINPEG